MHCWTIIPIISHSQFSFAISVCILSFLYPRNIAFELNTDLWRRYHATGRIFFWKCVSQCFWNFWRFLDKSQLVCYGFDEIWSNPVFRSSRDWRFRPWDGIPKPRFTLRSFKSGKVLLIWHALTIELLGLRWLSEGYDKWHAVTIESELHGLRWQQWRLR